MIPALLLATALDLRLDYTRQSLTATYRHYTQYVNGVPVLGGEVIERVDADGSVHEVVRALASDPHPAFGHPLPQAGEGLSTARVNIGGEARPARRVIIDN